MTQNYHSPVVEKPSDELEAKNFKNARAQGEAYQKAISAISKEDVHGKEKQVDYYLVNYEVEEAEGMYFLKNGKLEWVEPENANCHIELIVRDAGDGRFIPGLSVTATVLDSKGKELGTHPLPFLWHPYIYHYGHDWHVPGEGEYSLRIHIDVPDFPRHDMTNGKRFDKPVDVEFTQVKIKTGRKQSKIH